METLSKESLSLLESLIQTGSSSFGDGIAERITDYLEQNLEQNVSLDMLAQSMNYSAAYLSRLIKKNTGQSFSELLLDLRLKKSMELLRLTDMRINDIAAKAGYNDVSYFISIFKKCTGVTPKEWRSLAKLGSYRMLLKNRRILIFRIRLFFPFIYLRIISSRPGPLDTIVIGTSISFSTNSIYLRQFSGRSA